MTFSLYRQINNPKNRAAPADHSRRTASAPVPATAASNAGIPCTIQKKQ
jgi:hypothetical protein